MTELITQLKNSTQLRMNRVHKFKAKVQLYQQLGPYVIKTAETQQELLESFRLRHEVFQNEFRGVEGLGIDCDRFDSHFDHLIIVHKETDKVVGTYRLNCSAFSLESYTALEFELGTLRKLDVPVLELGRACIHKDFRKGAVISLLWRGIAEYMTLCEAELLFGCSSLKVNNARDAALVFRYLEFVGHVTHTFKCRPTKKFSMKKFDVWYAYFGKELSPEQIAEAEGFIPSLVSSYLRLGAKVACEPAFDEEFDCIDLLTVLKRKDLSQGLASRLRIVKS